ncbi:MAG: LTA synthase family protein [Clostridiales bacterium]|nr:LTA synthase family protein [Clostridiales bacterium]
MFYAILALYSEMVFRLMADIGMSGLGRTMFLSLLGAAFFSLFISCIPKKPAFVITEISVLFFSLLYIAQLLYHHMFKEFCSIDKLATGTEAIAQFNDVLFTSIGANVLGLILLLLPIIAPLILFRLRFLSQATRLPLKYVCPPLALLIVWHFLLLIPVVYNPYSERAERYGQGEQSRVSSVREIGLIASIEVDLLSQFIAEKTLPLTEQFLPLPPIQSPKPTVPVFVEVNELPEQAVLPEWLGKVNGLDIDFAALLERDAANKKLTQLHEYFNSLEPTEQNEHSGICAGYNLITICAEAFSSYAVDPQLTPTLYMMQNEGVNCLNFYSIYGSGTIGGELSLVTGLMPRGGETWCKEAARAYLPFSLAAQFNGLGVQPYAYHSGSYTYYDRHKMFPALGYIYKARKHGLEIKTPDWHVSDKEMIELSLNDYINDDLFYVHYMTLSGHSPYTFGGNPLSKKNQEAVADLPYSSKLKAYLACQIELEHALNYLLEQLEEAGIAERTLIVISPDHYPYGLTKEEISELAGHPVDPAFELYKSSCIIYAKGMTPITIEAPVFVPDIVPTVSNLLGFSFDSRFFSGRDIFSTAPALVFLDTGFISDAGAYNRNLNSFTPTPGLEIEIAADYRKTIQNIIDAKKSATGQMIKLDYFAQIRDYL